MGFIFNLLHQLYELKLVILGMWPSCPRCGNVGYWRPFGGWFSTSISGDNRGKRRWLCKWCGYYVDGDGPQQAVITQTGATWCLLKETEAKATTPEILYNQAIHAWQEGKVKERWP